MFSPIVYFCTRTSHVIEFEAFPDISHYRFLPVCHDVCQPQIARQQGHGRQRQHLNFGADRHYWRTGKYAIESANRFDSQCHVEISGNDPCFPPVASFARASARYHQSSQAGHHPDRFHLGRLHTCATRFHCHASHRLAARLAGLRKSRCRN